MQSAASRAAAMASARDLSRNCWNLGGLPSGGRGARAAAIGGRAQQGQQILDEPLSAQRLVPLHQTAHRRDPAP